MKKIEVELTAGGKIFTEAKIQSIIFLRDAHSSLQFVVA